MCLLLETIKLENGQLINLEYHQQRFDQARKQLFGSNPISLDEHIQMPEEAVKGLFRCRVTYNKTILKVEFFPYEYRKIRSLKLVQHDSIDYRFKYADRELLQKLFAQRQDCDDIIIIKHGEVTDSSTGNLIFWDGNKWLTPKNPLLKGTQRQKLLDSKMIYETKIYKADIFKFRKAGIINAFWGFKNFPVIENTNIHL